MADNRLTTNINQFVISGNLTRDSELKTVGNGFNILNFTVANNYIQKSGESYEQKVNYLDCRVLGKRAEKLVNLLKKGASVVCSGVTRQERWQTQDGKTASKVTFQCENVEITRYVNSESSKPETIGRADYPNSDGFPEDIPGGDSIPF
ncbi:MAG: single-stranded DNA-binding protein [Lachnospiraceae bacterium]|nr:single-stranded DNA-binding protein [Lachnospiraceae bacterium]